MKFWGSRWERKRMGATTNRGTTNARPKGSARPGRCAACGRCMLCTKTSIVYLCFECKGGQG